MDRKGSWIIGGFIIGAIILIQSFRPGVNAQDEAYKTVTVMCDSVFFNENRDLIFAVRNKSGEHFYIDEEAAQGLDVFLINKHCRCNVVTFNYVDKWSVLNFSGSRHSISKVLCNDKLLWTKLKSRDLNNI